MTTHSDLDVVIIGAGSAGIGAAKRAQELGLKFILIEAMDRIGGRAYTESTSFGTPWDAGCHWLHSASVNAYRELADKYGLAYEKRSPGRRVHDGSRWLSDEESSTVEKHVYGELWGQIVEVGRQGKDVTAADVVDLADPWIPFLRTALGGEWSVDIPDVSTADDVAYRDTNENWPVVDGYGALVARHARGVPVSLSTPASRVDWSGPGVKVDTPSGTISARTALITVSTKIIQDGAIAFGPDLPDWKLEAYHAIKLGNANKISFKIDRNLLADSHSSGWVKVRPEQGMWFQLRAFDRDMANGYLAGKLGEETEAAGRDAMLALGREALVLMYGTNILKAIQAENCSMWQHEPWIRGAYGAAQPGKAHLRKDLVTPIDEKLYFAGESTSLDFFSTCHGAHLTGISAIEAINAARKEPGLNG
jgi:monoamine oxidase